MNLKTIFKTLSVFMVIVLFLAQYSTVYTPKIKANMLHFKVAKTLEEELKELEEEIQNIRAEKNELQEKIDSNKYTVAGYESQLSKLHGEVMVFQKEVDELTLQIKEIEINISILETEIISKKEEIAKNQAVVSILEQESQSRINRSYIQYRLYSGETSNSNIFNLDSVNDYFKDSQYKELIQADTNKILTQLAILRQDLKNQKEQLNTNLVAVKKEREVLDIKKIDLDKKQAELETKIVAYYAQINQKRNEINIAEQGIAVFEENEAQKEAEAAYIRQKIFDNFIPIEEGKKVLRGTYIGRQGATGWVTGEHLHFSVKVGNSYKNPCDYLPGGISGCSGNGNLSLPLSGSIVYTSGYGQRCFYDTYNSKTTCHFHNGIDIVGSPSGAPVYATHDGYLYKGVDVYGALYIILCEQSDCSGLKTSYWHLREF